MKFYYIMLPNTMLDKELELNERLKKDFEKYVEHCLIIDLYEFSAWLAYKGLSSNTRLAYLSDMKISMQFFSSYLGKKISLQDMLTIDINMFRALLASISKKSAKTQERLIATWKKWVLFKKNPSLTSLFEKISYPKIPDEMHTHIKQSTLEDLLATQANPSSWQDYRNRALIILLYSTGVRINEALGLRWSDVSKKHCKVEGKGSKVRYVPLLPLAYDALCDYKNALMRDMMCGADYVFVGRDLQKWHACAVARYFRKLVRDNNLPALSPHSLRHACASHLLQSGCNLRSIQALLGHASLETTKVYIQHSIEDLKAAHKKVLGKN